MEPLDGLRLSAHHQAVAAFQAPDTAAYAGIDIVQTARLQFPGAADVVGVVGIAAVDDDVVIGEQRREFCQRVIHDAGGNHNPGGPRRCELAHKIFQGKTADGSLAFHLADEGRALVEHHALMSALVEPPHHIGAHPAEADHPELHL